jgi:hypothetical protein
MTDSKVSLLPPRFAPTECKERAVRRMGNTKHFMRWEAEYCEMPSRFMHYDLLSPLGAVDSTPYNQGRVLSGLV